MWGIVPAAGRGSRMQPLAFSKELLPVGTRRENGRERPLAVSEHLLQRLLIAGVDRVCFVISPGKSDIMEYFGGRVGKAAACYVVQNEPHGLCDALFRPLPFIADDEWVYVGLPDTIWFPEDGLRSLEGDEFSFLLFPVERPELFDAVDTDEHGNVREIRVKAPGPSSSWVWGAFRLRGRVLRELHELWSEAGRGDEYLGTLVNAYLGRGGRASGVKRGRAYVDVGTMDGFRQATRLLELGETP
jgi:glucose-1-phosphate thymidylyltransferase